MWPRQSHKDELNSLTFTQNFCTTLSWKSGLQMQHSQKGPFFLLVLTSLLTSLNHHLKWWKVTALNLVFPKCDNVTFSSVINLTQLSGGLVRLNIRLQSGRQKVKACLWHCSRYSSQPPVLIPCNSLECAFWDDGETYHVDGNIWRSLLAQLSYSMVLRFFYSEKIAIIIIIIIIVLI